MRTVDWIHLAAILFCAAVFLAAGPADLSQAQEKDGDKALVDLLAAARKEGKVVVKAPPNPEARVEIPAKFRERFGITVEYVAGRSSEQAAKLRAEREAGLYTTDVLLGGIQTLSTVFYREGMLDRLKPMLTWPEVIDAARWKNGALPFADPDGAYVLRLFSYVDPLFYINTQHVTREELTSTRDLLHPRWKGKIAVLDPMVAGSGGNTAAQFYLQFGEGFVKQFYLQQQPAVSRDNRQIADWLARGTYPITPDASSAVERMLSDGFPIAAIYSLSDAGGSLSAGNGHLAVLSRAPHPNAARLFVNWLASREGVGLYARALMAPSTRTDVDESFLDPRKIPRPGVKYFDAGAWDYNVQRREQAQLRVRELLRR
ncbi:MAG: ABC transporter substrate-binding protein [Candidatus Binatia bacterium]